MIISIFFLLLLFGGGALLALVVLAIVRNRPWVLALAGGLVFMGIIAAGLVATIYFARVSSENVKVATVGPPYDLSAGTEVPTQIAQQMDIARRAANQEIQRFNVQPSIVEITANHSGVEWSKVLIVILLVVFLITFVLRRLMSPAGGHMFRRALPVCVVLTIGVLLFSGLAIKPQIARRDRAAAEAMQSAAEELAAQQQILRDHPGAVIASQTSTTTHNPPTDIHEQMDKFDAPRIQFPPQPASLSVPSPAAYAKAPAIPPKRTAADMTAEAEASDDQSPPKHKQDDKAKPAVASAHKRKKSDKKPAGVAEKPAETVVRSEPTDAPGVAKENPLAEKKLLSIANVVSGSRPAWTYENYKRIGNVRREVIETEEYATAGECNQAADVYLLLKTHQYVQQLVGRPTPVFELPSITFHHGMILADGNVISVGGPNSSWSDPRLRYLNNLGINALFVRSEMIAKDANGEAREFVETVDHPGMGPMKKQYLQLEFTPALECHIRQRLDAEQRQNRFAMAGVGAGSVLTLLGLVFALLKIDTWTKGYYTKRLFIGVPAAIITGVFLLTMLASKTALIR